MRSAAPWRCHLVGRPDHAAGFAADLTEWIGAADLADRVRVLGPLVGDALDAEYASADLLLLPSRSETYGMVVTEALARGVPVVASDVGGIAEALGTSVGGLRPGRLVPVGDVALLSATIQTWLTKPGFRAELRDAARSRRGRLTGWDTTATEVAGVLDRAERATTVAG